MAYVGSLLIEGAIHSGVARLFFGMAYVGSLLIERAIHSGVARLFFGMAYVGSLLIEEAYTVCSALVRWRGLCRIFAYRTSHT